MFDLPMYLQHVKSDVLACREIAAATISEQLLTISSLDACS